MTKLKIKKDDEEITLVDEKDIQDKLDEKAKTIVTDNLTTDSSKSFVNSFLTCSITISNILKSSLLLVK